MKRRLINFVFSVFALIAFNGCSNLFENIINDDLSFKNGDDSLFVKNNGSDINSGLVVIKSSQKTVNQIIYTPSQKNYFVGKVPAGYSDFKINYENGTNVSFYGKDGPVELRCFVNDVNAKIQWSLLQTWTYIPEYQIYTTKDLDGNEIVYRGIKSQRVEKFENPVTVNFKVQNTGTNSFLTADLPYGVSVATCKVTADDEQYFTEYKIILTKEYIPSVADSPSEDANNVTEHGLVIIKASDPGRNAINFSSTKYEYEIGDSTGKDISLDLTGRDDPVIFKCFSLDKNAELTWKAVQTKEYVPEWDSNKGGITAQQLKELGTPVDFDFIKAEENYSGTNPFMQFTSDSKEAVKSNLPYGVTEVYAKITSYNEDENNMLVPTITQYKITLTKRYIITTGINNASGEDTTGLAVYANGKQGNLISYNPLVLDYSVEGLNGANDPVRIEFRPKEPEFTEITWTAEKTHSYEPEIEKYTNGNVSYTLQKNGKFVKLDESVNILNSLLFTEKKDGTYLNTGNLPYGITVVSVNAKSFDDKNSSTTYKISFNKKQVSTNINIISASGEEMSTVVDRGLVVLGAKNESLNRISFNPSKTEYNIDDVVAADNDMKFRCYLADTDAKIEWNVKQIKEFTAKTATYSEEVVDSFLGKKETKTYTYISGQTETDCEKEIKFKAGTSSDAAANEIIATLPYGITKVTATITSEKESTSVYTIYLRRDICKETVSEEDFKKTLKDGEGAGNYSQLKELEVKIVDDVDKENTKAKLTPEFKPSVTTYNLKVDEESDKISIEAIAAAEGAKIDQPKVITKYGEVTAVDGMTINLVGGKSRVTFTVTDETNISRTYTIYVEKPEDGDTTLESLDISPKVGFENGLALDQELITSEKGGSDSDKAKYNMTLSADSRVDVSNVIFKAVPTNKRTVVSYAISDSYDKIPAKWTTEFKKANPASETVTLGDDNVATITKVLWIKTVSDKYYHPTATGYETEKRSDTTYHKIQLTKAGNKSQELTAVAIDVTYEDGTTKNINLQTAKTEVAKKAVDVITGIDKITTFADVVEIYFRPLDKDAEITYTVNNTENSETKDITSEAKFEKISGACDKFNDGSNEYYKLTIGRKDTTLNSSVDFPRGETKVTICGRTFTFTKPDIKNVTYKLGLKSGELKWSNYIYLKYTEDSLNMTLTSEQQNQILSVKSCSYFKGPNNKEVTQAEIDEKNVNLKSEISGPENKVVWTNAVTNIPVGTTKLVITVKNGTERDPASKDYTYYIVRADSTETRLKTLSFGGVTPTAFATDWNNGMKDAEYTYVYSTKLNVAAGVKTLSFEPVNSEVKVTVTRKHSYVSGLTVSNSTDWKEEKTVEVIKSASSPKYTYSEEFKEENGDDNAGSIMYSVKIESDATTEIHTYNIIIYVEADKTVQLDALKIIQMGETDDLNRTILANSFTSEELNYNNLPASLNYKGNIVITPTKYAKARIIKTVLKCGDEEITSTNTAGITIAENGTITIPYSAYSEKLGKTYTVSYEVQAQDTSVATKTYTAAIAIPEYETITENKKTRSIKEFSYDVVTGEKGGLGYRFGSVIADQASKAKDLFGGMDIVGTPDGNTWYESSFGGSGFQFVLNIDEKDYWVKLGADGKLSTLYSYIENPETKEKEWKVVDKVNKPEGIDFAVVPEFKLEGETQYLELKFDVTNTSGKAVKLGAAIDTLIGTVEESAVAANDRVKVVPTNNGFTMNGKKYSFSVLLKNAYGVDDVKEFWYGAYDPDNLLMKVFDETKKSGLKTNEDSAASFYWDIGDVSSSKTIRITMESVK